MHYPSVKYYGEQGDAHGGQLHWPGVNGIPFRGSMVPNLKRRELEQLPVVGQGCHDTFDLSDPKQSAVYAWVRDRIRNGLFTQDLVMHQWHPTKPGVMIVYIEWTQLYIQLPTGQFIGSNGNGSPDSFALRSA